jgi:LEA14-like dessication related protein
VPILGELTVPARVEGTFPVVRVPRIRVASLKLESLTIAGADLNLAIAVDNPNSFGLTIDQFEYSLEIANQPWSTGQAPRRQTVPPGSSSVLTLPFTVRFASVGRSVRDVLRGQAPLQYSLAVQAGIVTDLAILPRLDLPLDLAGTVDLSR